MMKSVRITFVSLVLSLNPLANALATTCLNIPIGSVVLECDSVGEGDFRYTFSVTNCFTEPVHHVYLLGGWPATFSQNHFQLNIPLAPDSTAGPFTTVVSGVTPQSQVCFLVSIHDSLLEECCSIENCVTSPCSTITTAIPEPRLVRFPQLEPNRPNPFNPSTTIGFWLPDDGVVALDIYDVKGRRVRTLINDFKYSGYHTIRWDAHDDLGSAVASGVYVCRLQFGLHIQTRKMVLMK